MIPSVCPDRMISVDHLRGRNQFVSYISSLLSSPILTASSGLNSPALMISWVEGKLLLRLAETLLMARTYERRQYLVTERQMILFWSV